MRRETRHSGRTVSAHRTPARPVSALARLAVRAAVVAACALMLAPERAPAQERLDVVTTLPTYAAITREITGDLADVSAIARGDEDPHFVAPRPSVAARVQRADVFVVTGLDLELWVPAVLDRANNPRVVEGGPGHVVAYSGIDLLQIPETVSRAEGDVHIYGNPHIHTDPINAILIARNILSTLVEQDAENADAYRENAEAFEDRVLRRLFGDELVEMLGADALMGLAHNHGFWDFVRDRTYEGRPLVSYLGGWLAEAEPFRGGRMVCYHKNWAYFSARFDIDCAMYIERRPGIPPSPGHVREVMSFIQNEDIPVLFAANYYSRSQIDRIATRTGARAVIVPEHVRGEEGIEDYFALIDLWVSRLAAAFDGR